MNNSKIQFRSGKRCILHNVGIITSNSPDMLELSSIITDSLSNAVKLQLSLVSLRMIGEQKSTNDFTDIFLYQFLSIPQLPNFWKCVFTSVSNLQPKLPHVFVLITTKTKQKHGLHCHNLFFSL